MIRSRPSFSTVVARWLVRRALALLFDVQVSGRSNIQRAALAGWIVAGVPHRNWSEPVLLHTLAPSTRSMVTVAQARTVEGSWRRRAVAAAMGGVIAVGDGAGTFSDHLRTAARAIAQGDMVAIFPETGPPSRPPRLRRLSPGVAHFAAASGAPVVPVVFGGTDELYLRRRIQVVVLPPLAPPASADRTTVDEWMKSFTSTVRAAAEDAQASADSRPPRRKHWLWMTGHYPRV